jgi:hypothetical protein
LEQRIRELCSRLLAAQDEAEFHALARQLREALHQKIEQLRHQARQLDIADQLLLLPPGSKLALKESVALRDWGKNLTPPAAAESSTKVQEMPGPPAKRKARRPPDSAA